MSGLLDTFDDAFRGAVEPAGPPPARPAPEAPTPGLGERVIDARARAIADRLLGRSAVSSPAAVPPGAAAAVVLVGPCGPAPLVGPLTIGRSEHADVVVGADVVSRRHACVDVVDGGLTVRDLGSANGTVVLRGSSVVVVGNLPVALRAGDVLTTDRGRARLARVEPAAPAGTDGAPG